jgi:hypothetical protein
MKISRTVLIIGIFLILQSCLRLFFYYEAVFAGVPLLQPMPSAATMNLINSINLILGLLGLIIVPGLYLMTGWGYWGIIALSAATIIFDGISSATVSFTALAGLILPILFLILLLPARLIYFKGARAHE